MLVNRPGGYKTFFMLNSTERGISKHDFFHALKLQDFVFILLINVEMPTIVGISILRSKINFMLN